MPANPKLKDTVTDHLFQAVLLLETEEECYQFFEDICTISELKALAQRLEVARMLKHRHTYDEIVTRTGRAPPLSAGSNAACFTVLTATRRY